MKGLITLAIEKVLLEIGKETNQKITERLDKKFRCDLPDCFEHPEYLNEVLKELYGNAFFAITGSISKELKRYKDRQPVEKFLKIVNKNSGG